MDSCIKEDVGIYLYAGVLARPYAPALPHSTCPWRKAQVKGPLSVYLYLPLSHTLSHTLSLSCPHSPLPGHLDRG
jgi:hypothetical protein